MPAKNLRKIGVTNLREVTAITKAASLKIVEGLSMSGELRIADKEAILKAFQGYVKNLANRTQFRRVKKIKVLPAWGVSELLRLATAR